MQALTVEKFLENGGMKLKIHILKKINDENYIGGDETKILHIKNGNLSNELTEGMSYMVIKPEKQDDDTLVLNPKFKPVKTAKLSLKSKSKLVDEIANKIKIKKDVVVEVESGMTLEMIETKEANKKLSKMTAKCLNISKLIPSKYGEFRIVKLRDLDNKKGDINLYKHTKNKMEVGKVYHIENFKVSNYKSEGSEFRRLGTLPITLITEVSQSEENKYKHIRLGDDEGEAVCIGIGKTHGYFGCANCWKKVEEIATTCTHCYTSTATKTMEFSTELYFEMESEIITLQGFRRHFHPLKIDSIETDKIEESLEQELVGNTLDVEFNEGDEDNVKKLVKVNKILQLRKHS